MRKKVVAMGLAAMMAMSLAACSSGGSSTSTTAAGSSAEATTAAAAASSEESKKGRYGFLSDSITALIHFHGQFFSLLFGCDIHIIPNNAQGRIVTLALKNSAAHFLRLFLHSILPECL